MSRRMRMNNFMLIECVKGRKPLWDRQASDKTELLAREKLWDEIAERLGSTKNIVKSRWKNIRDAYRKLIRKCQDGDPDPRWPYFKQMEFLREIAKNTVPRNQDIAVRKREEFSMDGYSPEADTSSASDPLGVGAPRGIKRQASEELPSRPFLDVGAERNSFNETTAGAIHLTDDDDYQFLLSLYPHFKQVPHNRKLPLRMKIEQVIYEELYSISSGNISH